MKILIVDDDSSAREVLGRILRRAGYDTQECHSGSEALSLLVLSGPALLVLDYEMPGINGAEVCRILRQHPDSKLAGLPIIMLTGHGGEQQEIECLRAGANDFVTKPVQVPVLKARIDTQLRLYGLRQQLEEQNAALARYRNAQEQDLEAARLTQRAILPHQPPVVFGWDCAIHYQPLIQVGGDAFDFVDLPNGGVLAWMADATGHGVAAALLTALTKLLFLHGSAESFTPAEVMRAVNHDFRVIFGGTSFMTAACLVLSPGREEVLFSGAGHPPLLVLRKEGGIDALRSTAPPLGLESPAGPGQEVAHLEPGDGLLLYTDGLYSVTEPSGQRMSQRSLMSLIVPARRAVDLIDSTLDSVRRHAREDTFTDDIAVFAAIRL